MILRRLARRRRWRRPTWDCVVAHGLGTIDDDRLEAQAIRDTLGDVPVTAPKSYFGHLATAAGALETVVGVLALRHGLIPPTLNYEHPDPQCPINVIHGQPAPLAKSRCPGPQP